jgi:hypothetical protein
MRRLARPPRGGAQWQVVVAPPIPAMSTYDVLRHRGRLHSRSRTLHSVAKLLKCIPTLLLPVKVQRSSGIAGRPVARWSAGDRWRNPASDRAVRPTRSAG